MMQAWIYQRLSVGVAMLGLEPPISQRGSWRHVQGAYFIWDMGCGRSSLQQFFSTGRDSRFLQRNLQG